MKTILLTFLITISLVASEKEAAQTQSVKEEIKYIVDAKNYGLIAAKDAFYVIDSHKYGTMQDYFAFAKEEDANEHVKKYGGNVVDYETYKKIEEEASK
ncbi:nitrous oxide reductase accessory protein NosL [Sulfurimonas sp.]|uniref:nitrous oxide reductase accessory protein NosL n=1 Tax=Sulfurimonas sp. TaxID=2022749 RepID=UPI0019FC5E8A|nr:nitrous oxide reductase accessory protein NosL [Sulfurimonas sp.]MBE0514755.1 nitrous oxide reductase accessory protein NosL [Sulfurimonas sp.]